MPGSLAFSDAVVIITGAASGLGRALAERFVAAGARVAALDVNAGGLDRLAAAHAKHILPIICDLRDPEQIKRAARRVKEDLGPVDILINNAGVVTGKPLAEQSDNDLLKTFEVNTFAPFRMTRAVLPSMIERGRGHIVTIASAGGWIAAARMSAYASSKFAAVGFDEALRFELREAGHPIDTTVVCPFFINTGMFEGVHSPFPLLPILRTDRVADRVMRAIRRKKRRLLMPWLVYLVFPLRLLPVSWFDAFARLLGVSSAMAEFRGRRPRDEAGAPAD